MKPTQPGGVVVVAVPLKSRRSASNVRCEILARRQGRVGAHRRRLACIRRTSVIERMLACHVVRRTKKGTNIANNWAGHS
eukprot:2622169-Pleurochrysis_carterae.AAC.5